MPRADTGDAPARHVLRIAHMRVLAIAFALSLFGCVDDVSDDPVDDQDSIGTTDEDGDGHPDTPTIPDPTCGGAQDGVDGVSRKKADGACVPAQ